MRITDCKEIVGVKRYHDYDYRVTERSYFNIFFPIPAVDSFYNDILSESVLCADLTFPLMDRTRPTLKVYISKHIYELSSIEIPARLMFYKPVPKNEDGDTLVIPKKMIDKAIESILGENRLDAYLTTYNKNGVASATVTIPKPYVTMDMVDDAPVLTMASL